VNLDQGLAAGCTRDGGRGHARGEPEPAFGSAPHRIDAVYCTSDETHNPMEMPATAARLDGDELHVVSQSGGIPGSLLSRVAARGIGLSKLVSTSSEVDLDVADFVDFLVDHRALPRDAARPREVPARRVQGDGRGQAPIVAFKVGRSEAGVRSAVSHTGALGGADRMCDALFAQLGIIRAHIPAGD
jgi:acyl-CoA synthetase (NDP forming)